MNDLQLPQAVIDLLPVAISISSAASGRIVQYNRPAAELWGCEAKEDRQVCVPCVQNAMARVIETGVAVRALEQILERPDGSRRRVIASIDPIRDESGEVIGAINVSQDVTERPESEAAPGRSESGLQQLVDSGLLDLSELHAMRKKTQSLEATLIHNQKLELLGQLAGVVAHDFNNLLMVISSQAELLLEPSERNRVEGKARRILSATESAGQLTRKLLAFGRKQELASSTFDLNPLMSEVAGLFKNFIPKDILVEVRLSNDPCWIDADRMQMQQTLLNLVLNATDAMPDGGWLVLRTSPVVIASNEMELHGGVPAGDYALITVADTGQGIPEQLLGRIFEPFFTTKSRERGTGLGLSIAHGIVSQSGGHMRVSSSVDAGTTFSVYLPAAARPAKERPRSRPCPLGRSNASCAREGTILLVDDEELVRGSVRMFLEHYGLHVVDCANGTEALKVASELKDEMTLLITDFVMPKMTGGELAQSLVSRRPELPVIFISGYAAGELGQEQIKGAKFLQKPFTRAKLAETVCMGLGTCPRQGQG